MNKKLEAVFFTFVLSVCLVVPFSNDIFISGFPAISAHFPGHNVSLILGVGLLGLAMAQPIYGPLLDRFGRRPILLIGLCIYTLASLLVILTNLFSMLLLARFIQSAAAGSAIVATFAIAKDTYEKEKLVNATSLIMALIAISPTIAPLVGSILNTLWGWRASFAFLFVAGCFFTVLIQLCFRETQKQKNMQALIVHHIIGNYWTLIKNSNFLLYCLLSGLSYSILFSYFSLSSLFIIQQMHFSLISYGVIVALNSIAIISTAILMPKFSRSRGLLTATKLGFLTMLVGGVLMYVINIYFVTNIYSFTLPMFLTTIGIGMIRPTASAGALRLVEPQIIGSASAFFGFVSFVGSAIGTTVSAELITHVPGFGIFIIVLALLALLLIVIHQTKLSCQQKTSASLHG